MTMTEIKIKQWGNSLGLIIPKEIVKREELHEGEVIKIEISKGKRVDGFGIFKGGPSFKRELDGHDDLW